MGSLRATLRAATLANRFLGYIVTVILVAYAETDLGKKLQEMNIKHNTELSSGEIILQINGIKIKQKVMS